MRKTVIKGALLALCFAFTVTGLQAEPRTWTDTQGRTVDAEYLGFTGAGRNMMVRLKRADGQEFQFPYVQLSEADQVYVRNNVPKDARGMAREIDRLVAANLQKANIEIREEGSKLFQTAGIDPKQKAKDIEELKRQISMTSANPLTNDEQFIRRIYLDIAGRIPTYDEWSDFMSSRSQNKRAEVIDKLLDSDAFTMHMFNWYSDLLRIRSQVSMNANQLKANGYVDWVKDNISADTNYDEIVRKMLTASGTIWDNPETGYLMTDLGMPFCNLSNTFTVFLGTEITCAQCHDHPFEEVYQMDFYKMASFMGEVKMRQGGVDRGERDRLQKLLRDGGKLGPDQRFDNGLNNILGTYSYNVGDGGSNAVKLPHDYKYDDGEPFDSVKPGAYLGDVVDLEQYETPRAAFAAWITSENNPRFTINIVNRLWKKVFGVGQIEPVYNIPGHLDGQAENYELLKFLEDTMKEVDYSVKDFLRILYNTQTYQREANRISPSLVQMDNGTYHFPGPVLRRMSAEQLWDSLVTLTTPNADGVRSRGLEEYQAVMNTDLATLSTADAVMKYKEQYGKVGGLSSMGGEMMMGDTRVGGTQMIRASEMRLPQNPGSFLREFGQSDKLIIENQYTSGSSPQVMTLLNGSITNKVLTNKDSHIMKMVAEGSASDRVERIFVSVLGRRPTGEERSAAIKAAGGGRDGEEPEYGDLIWALVNTHEFMFVQ